MIDENSGNQILIEIRELLQKLFVCFEDQYNNILERKREEKLTLFNKILSDNRKKIFPLLFDERNYSQTEIAEKAGVSQPAVSGFIKQLIDNEIIEQYKNDGMDFYIDKYNFLEQLTSK